MPPTLQELGIDRLDVDDRLALAQAIWDSVAREIENLISRLTSLPSQTGCDAYRQCN